MKISYDSHDDLLQSSEEKWQGFDFYCGGYSENSYQVPHKFNHLHFDIIPLSQTRTGDIFIVVEINPKINNLYLHNMGLFPEKELKVISRNSNGSIVLILHNRNIGLGAYMARACFSETQKLVLLIYENYKIMKISISN